MSPCAILPGSIVRTALLVLILSIHAVSTPAQSTKRKRPDPICGTVGACASLLSSTNSDTRAAAAEQLGRLDSTAIPALTIALHDSVERVRYFATRSLVWLAPPGLRAMLAELPRVDSAAASDMVLAISELDYSGDTATNAILMRAASDSNLQLRLAAIYGADLMHADDADAWIAVLGRFVDSPSTPLRLAALERLGEVGPIAEPEVPRMLRALRDSDPTVRGAALRALSGLGGAGGRAVNGFVEVMRADPDTILRVEAAGRLGDLRDAGALAVPALLEALDDSLAGVRDGAARSLGEIGIGSLDSSLALAVVDSLARLSTGRDSSLRHSAVASLAMLDGRSTASLAALTRSPDSTVARIAIGALALRTEDPTASGALFTSLGDARPDIGRSAADAIGSMGIAALPRLRQVSVGRDSVAGRNARRAEDYIHYATRLPVAGRCYKLVRAAWGSSLDHNGDSIFTNNPDIIRFTTIKHVDRTPTTRPEMEVQAASGSGETIDGPGTWRPISQRDSLEIVWSNGYSGVVMQLAVRGDSLSGRAKTFWDFPRPSDATPVHGIRVVCNASLNH